MRMCVRERDINLLFKDGIGQAIEGAEVVRWWLVWAHGVLPMSLGVCRFNGFFSEQVSFMYCYLFYYF